MGELIYNCLLGALCGVWAFLWTGPLSDPEEVFGALKAFSYRHFPWWIHKPLIGCAKCNAPYWAAALMGFRHSYGLPVGAEIIVVAIFTGYILQKQYV